MGEWENGLDAAASRGLISEAQHAELLAMDFGRELAADRFPIRIALYILGATLLVVAAFAAVARALGDEPSQLVVSAVFLALGGVIELVARLMRRNAGLHMLSGIVGAAAGVSLGVALAVVWPGDPEAGHGSLGALLATAWSISWFVRTGAGLVVAAAIAEAAVGVLFFFEWVGVNDETAGVVLCALGLSAALASILGKIRPSLPPLVASLVVIGIGCLSQGTFGGVAVAGTGAAISAVLFVVAYRKGEVLMSAATAISTGVWAVVLAFALTSGAVAPLIVAAVIGVVLIIWGSRLSRR